MSVSLANDGTRASCVRGETERGAGESGLGVEMTARPVPSQTSHDQPEPKRLMPASII